MEPSLPVPCPSLSFWHRTTRAFPHLNANRQAPVPKSTPYLIIGSGISGSLTAYELIQSGVSARDIVILEAREAVSGATGRNAGHIRPDAFRGFLHFAALHGPLQARKILENEREVLERVRDFVAANDVDCEFHHASTFDVCLTEEFADRQARSLAAYRDAGGDVSHVKFWDGEEARRKTRHPRAVCAYEWPAASNHPAKLGQWVLGDVIAKGAGLWTHCPATEVSAHDGRGAATEGEGGALPRWKVKTPRGTIAAGAVIHCTNAYAAYLVPGLRGYLSPHRAQAQSFVPPESASGADMLQHTMSLRYSLQYFHSVIQTRGTGSFIFGGSLVSRDADVDKTMVTFDDRGYNEVLAEANRKEFSGVFFSGPGAAERWGEGFDHAWTGILGMTPDSVPVVGPIEGLDGQWICAGFNGHGMARIFACAPGLVKLIMGRPWADTGLPECFRYSQERLDKHSKGAKALL